jgi:hypothetical protein
MGGNEFFLNISNFYIIMSITCHETNCNCNHEEVQISVFSFHLYITLSTLGNMHIVTYGYLRRPTAKWYSGCNRSPQICFHKTDYLFPALRK